jgi:hypothetical protein
MRTFSVDDSAAGYLDFTIPLQSPEDVDVDLFRKLFLLPISERISAGGLDRV